MKSILNRLSLGVLLTALTVPAISTDNKALNSAEKPQQIAVEVKKGSTLSFLVVAPLFKSIELNRSAQSDMAQANEPQSVTYAELYLFKKFPAAQKAINAALKEGNKVTATVKITPEKTSFTATVTLDTPKSPMYTFKSIKNTAGETISPANFNYAYSYISKQVDNKHGYTVQGPIYQDEYHLTIYPEMLMISQGPVFIRELPIFRPRHKVKNMPLEMIPG